MPIHKKKRENDAPLKFGAIRHSRFHTQRSVHLKVSSQLNYLLPRERRKQVVAFKVEDWLCKKYNYTLFVSKSW